MTPSTKIDLNHRRIARLEGLEELAEVLFPGNQNHQRVFLAVFVELKYAGNGFVRSLTPLCAKCGFSERSLETVRAKMRRLGLIGQVSRFSPKHGFREGWVLSSRFSKALCHLGEAAQRLRERRGSAQEQFERDLHRYI